MAKLPHPQAPGISALVPGPDQLAGVAMGGPAAVHRGPGFRVEEMARDNRYVIRAELPGLDPDRDIEVTVEGRTLTIHAERRQEDSGPYRSEFRYGSLTRLVRLPARVDAKDVTARYDKGVLESQRPDAGGRAGRHTSTDRERRLSPGRNPRDGRNQRAGRTPLTPGDEPP